MDRFKTFCSKFQKSSATLNKRKINFTERNYIERTFQLEKTNYFWYNSETEHFVKDLSEDSLSELHLTELEDKVIILSGVTGIGKSTLLPSICKKIENKNHSSWIEIIKLTDHNGIFSEFSFEDDSVDFLSTKILKYDKITDQQFKQQIQEGKNTVIMFDGCDELSNENREHFLNFIDKLVRTSNIKQIWITTDASDRQFLASRFLTLAYHLMKFSKDNKIQYFRNYWNDDEEFSKKLIENLEMQGIDIGIPLYTKLASDYFLPIYLSRCQEIPKGLTTTELYSRIVRTNGEIDSRFASPNNSLLDILNSIWKEEPNLYHRSFAEYTVAQFLFKKLTDKSSDIDDKILELLLTEVIVNEEYETVRHFLNDLLGSVILTQINYEKLSKKFLIFFENNPKGVWLARDYSEMNILELIYESVRLFSSENNKKFREHFQALFSYIGQFSKNLTFLEKAFEENSEIMQQNLDYADYLLHVLKLDSIRVLDKYQKALEKQLTSEDLETFLTNKLKHYHMTYYFNRTFIFNLSDSCSDYFLNYLKDKLNDFKSFLIFSDDKEDTFFVTCSQNAIKWIKTHMDENFYKLCLKLSNRPLNLITEEEKFIYNFNEITKSKIFDFKFSNEMYYKSLRKSYPSEVTTLTMDGLRGKFRTSFEDKIKLVNENIRKASEEDHIDMLIKVLEFYSDLFSSRKDDFMKQLDPPFNFLTFEELKMLLSNAIESFSDKLKAHLIAIGKVGVLLRYANNFFIKNKIDDWPPPELEEKEIFKVQLMAELLQISEINEKLRLEAIIVEVDNQERIRNIMNKTEYCFEQEYLLEIIQLLIPEPYCNYFRQNPLIADYCYKILIKIID